MDLVTQAEELATLAHMGQFRHDGKTPYIEHPRAVAAMLGRTDEKVVAWLHDVLEDTDMSKDELVAAGIPGHMIDAVVALTQRPGEGYADYHRRVAANPLAVRVKIADMCHNLTDNASKRSARKYGHFIAHIVLGVPLPHDYGLDDPSRKEK